MKPHKFKAMGDTKWVICEYCGVGNMDEAAKESCPNSPNSPEATCALKGLDVEALNKRLNED